eukprot:gene6370-4414_t
MSDVPEKPDPKAVAKRNKQVFLVNFHFTVNLMSSILTWNTRSTILLKLLKGDSKKLAKYLAGWTLAIGAGEFLLNPTVGKLSDAIGRKPFMLLSPIMNIVMKTMVALNPSIWTLSLEKVFCDGLRTMSGTTMATNSLMDLLEGKDLMEAFGWFQTYVAAIGISSLHLAGLPKDQRRTYSGFVSPFDCYKLFTNGSALATTTLQQMCQWFVEAKNLADINAVIGQ